MPDKCENCGHDEFYRLMLVIGDSQYHYRFDGKNADNSHIHETLDYREKDTMYCCQCNKKIGSYKKWIALRAAIATGENHD